MDKMVNCPKCGFSQPQDQYCASCGVDMLAFRPVPKPLAQRFFRHPGTQIATAIALALGLTFYIRAENEEARQKLAAEIQVAEEAERQEAELAAEESQNSQQAMLEDMEASAKKIDAETESSGDSAATDDAKLVSSSQQEPAPKPIAAGTAAAAALTSNTPSPSAGAGATTAASPATNALPSSIRVTFAEASKIAVSELMNDARQSGGDGNVVVGVVANYEQKLTAPAIASGWRSLDEGTAQQIRLNQPSIVAKGARDPGTGQILGFTVQLIPTQHDQDGTQLQVEIARVMRDQSGQPVSFEFAMPETFIVPKGSAIVISGTLPRGSLPPQDERLYQSINVLKSLASPAFKNDATDGVIVIDMK